MAAAEVPVSLAHQGRILDNAGQPVTDSIQMQVSLYNSAEGGAILWQDQLDVQPDETGFYTVTLGGADNPIDQSVLRDGDVFLAIAIDDGEELTPRSKLHAVPYAQIARRAESVADASIGTSALALEFGLDASRINSVDWSTINGVPSDLADGDDDVLGGMSCQIGQVPSYDGANWNCRADRDTLGQMSCQTGQQPEFDGSTWTCVDRPSYDGADFALSAQSCATGEVAIGIAMDGALICTPKTTYSAGTGLALNGSSFEVDTSYLDGKYTHADQSCPAGAVVQGINPDGTLDCDSGTGRYDTYTTTLNDTTTDLGDQLSALMSQHRAVSVTLEQNRIYTWNNPVSVGANQALYINGEGVTNGANNISVTIRMNQNNTYAYNGTDYRNPARLYLRQRALFSLSGVEIQESANDSRPLAPPGNNKALFNVVGDQAIFTFVQSRMTTTEDVTNFAGHTYARIKFGWTYIDKASGSVRNIAAVKADSGWSFGGNGGVVSRSHTTLGAGVSYSSDANITYLN